MNSDKEAVEVADKLIRKVWGLGDETTPTLLACPLSPMLKDISKQVARSLTAYGEKRYNEGVGDAENIKIESMSKSGRLDDCEWNDAITEYKKAIRKLKNEA